MTPKFQCEKSRWRVSGSSRESMWGSSGSEIDKITTRRHCIFCHSFYVFEVWTWVTYISYVLSIKTILFGILDFWCQLVMIRFVKTLSKRRMFVSFMKISAYWLLHRLIKFNKICWEKRPAKPRPNLRTSFCRRDLKNTQPHRNEISYKSRSDPYFKQKTETELTFWYVLPYFVHSGPFQTKQKEKQGCTSHIWICDHL